MQLQHRCKLQLCSVAQIMQGIQQHEAGGKSEARCVPCKIALHIDSGADDDY